MLLINLHLRFVLHSSQQTGAAEVQADSRSCESTSLQCRTDAGCWEWWLCWLSSWPCLAMGSCSWLSSLEASPTPHSHCGPLRAAVSCNQQRASSLPAASAPSTAVQEWVPNPLCCRGGKFWQRARQKAGGSSYVGALLMGIQFFQGSQKPYSGILQFYPLSSASCAQQCYSFTALQSSGIF